jgi:beta-lactamase regulating signal transducer with metallopeptidase domain
MPAVAHQIIPLAVEHTLDSLLGGILLSGIAWAWLRIARRQNSASRFFILFILLIGIAVLPIFGLSWIRPAAFNSGLKAHSLVTLPSDFAAYLFIGWAIVAFVLLTRIVLGFLQLSRLKKSCYAFPAGSAEQRTMDALHESPRAVELCLSDRVSVPTALGFTRPAIIAIPHWLEDQLTPEELHHLVLHELAHLRRWDDWTTLAQRILGAVLFFHPAVWWLQSRISLEREMACDECVLAQTGNARAYAKSLATMAERSFVRRTFTLAQAAVSHLQQTTQRVTKILAPIAPRRAYSTALLFVSMVSFGGLTVAASYYSPDLVSFTSTPAAPKLEASLKAPLPLVKLAPKTTLASLKSNLPASSAVTLSLVTRRSPIMADKPQADAALSRRVPNHPPVIQAKATPDRVLTTERPEWLVVWQATYNDNGSLLVVERSYWRVIVFQNIHLKEQPRKAI